VRAIRRSVVALRHSGHPARATKAAPESGLLEDNAL
jgi:hypothetical protein